MEHAGLYDEAVAAGRAESASNPASHFVDDESRRVLFWGYSAAAFELRAQLAELNVEVRPERPLVVHIPCGVGGALDVSAARVTLRKQVRGGGTNRITTGLRCADDCEDEAGFW